MPVICLPFSFFELSWSLLYLSAKSAKCEAPHLDEFIEKFDTQAKGN
jgi:hypothetical protein